MNQQITWAQIIAAYMPAAIIMVTILLGIMSNNRAIDGVQRRIDDLRADTNRRFDDLSKELRDRFDRIDLRFARLEEHIEHPVIKSQ